MWGLWDNNVSLEQIHSDWHLFSFAAKWLDEDEVRYFDQSAAADVEDDYLLLQELWLLIDAADIVIGHNLKKFDKRKIYARFLLRGFKPPSSFKMIDTLEIAKRHFDFTSNKLAYLSERLCKTKKRKHKLFPGFELWSECRKGNPKAWAEMKRYNIDDVWALQELWEKLQAWDSSINFALYYAVDSHVCSCGNREFKLQGYAYTAGGKFQRYRCKKCGRESRDNVNLLGKMKRKLLMKGTR